MEGQNVEYTFQFGVDWKNCCKSQIIGAAIAGVASVESLKESPSPQILYGAVYRRMITKHSEDLDGHST